LSKPEEDATKISDFGRLTTFGLTLVEITIDAGISGYDASKAQVGSASDNQALLALMTDELKPLLVGRDPRQISALWEERPAHEDRRVREIRPGRGPNRF
jgi:L-alanine-DL-glutamate epimerase-like enolase superfamily enzyme